MQYSIPKGLFDILPYGVDEESSWRQSHRWQYIESLIKEICYEYGFQEIRTPIFERTELFVRGVGENSDIVTKEMYTFEDKGGRSMTLRPEGTACVMRSFVEHNFHSLASVHKLFYIGPMFRYERPQAGRYRQLHQFGAEVIGMGKPEQDVEIIDLLYELYKRLGIKNLKIHLNSIGDQSSRVQYLQALKDFLSPHFDHLSEDSKMRFEKNILRILDSKNCEDQKILAKAPSILDFLNEECKEHFDRVCQMLSDLHIPFQINARLVRGLDYYNKTVFEITSEDLGAQNSLVGGGRYDGLTSAIGGISLPSVGFATGLERVLQTMIKQSAFFPDPPHPLLYIIPLGERAKEFSMKLTCQLRHHKIPTEIDISGKKVQHGLSFANQLRATFCLILGEDELSTGKAVLKNMNTRENLPIALSDILEKMKEHLKENGRV